MITFKHTGSFKNIEKFLHKASRTNILSILDKYGRQGVTALASATPTDSGLTADSWKYEVRNTKGSYSITWTNTNVVDGVPVAILLQYGHSTKNGGFVQGRDFINPAIQPIFDKIAEELWKEVTLS